MDILKKIGRVVLIIVAVLVILLSAGGIGGAWYANSVLSDVTISIFNIVETGVQVVELGVTRVETLVNDGRTEVQQVESTIQTVGTDLQENSPILTALNERLQERLAPLVDRIQTFLAPVRDAMITMGNVVSIANSMPFLQERAPRLDELDATLTELNQVAADVEQLDGVLRAAVVEGKNQWTQEVINNLTDLTSRIDQRLAETQSNLMAQLDEINTLQTNLAALRSRLLLYYDLSALALTLLFVWLIYSQIVVIRHQWGLLRRAPEPLPPPPPASALETDASRNTSVLPPPEEEMAYAERVEDTASPTGLEEEPGVPPDGEPLDSTGTGM